MKTSNQEDNDPLNNEHEQIGHTQVRKTDIDIIKGAQQTDQLAASKANSICRKNGRHYYKSIGAILVISALALGGFYLFSRPCKRINHT